MEDIIDIIVTETTNTIEITSQASDELIDVNIIDNREDITLNVTPTLVEININSLTGNFGVEWGDITGTLADQTDLNTALGLKADLVDGKVPSSQLPSYVDDIIEVATYSALPTTGETGKIYVVLDTNLIYRWSGSAYIEIKDSSAVWGAITGTLSSQTDLQNALNAKVPYTGATGNVNLGEYGATVGYLGFDTTPSGTPTGIGTMYWDSANRTVSLIDGDGDTTLQLGQEERVLVHNNTGSTLTDGQVVYVTGSTGELPSVALAVNTSDSTSSVTFGIVTESIAHGADGFITTSGIVHGLNTNAFTEGAALWLGSTAGTFTETKPVAPAHAVLVGYVIKKSGGNGSIFVKIQNGYELDELHDVLITSKANNDGLFYESSSGLWKNKSIATVLGYTPANGANYLPLTGGTLTGTLIGTRAEFTTSTLVDGILVNNGSGRGIRIVNVGAGYGLIINNETASSAIPFVIQKSGLDKIYFTDSGAGNFTSSLTASSFIKSGGTSSQYLMADGSVSTLTNPVTGTGTSGIVAKFNGTSSVTDSIIYDNGTRVSIGADVTTSNKFTAVASTTSSYAVVAQASGAANGFWATLSGTGEIFRGQTSGGSYFIINNGGNAFLNGNLNVGDFSSTSYRLNVVGTANFTGALSGTSATFSDTITINKTGASLLTLGQGSSSNDYGRINFFGKASGSGVSLLYMPIYNTQSGSSVLVGELEVAHEGSSADNKSYFSLKVHNGTSLINPLYISATGAATFSSSVTATLMGVGISSLSSWGSPFSVTQYPYGSYVGGTTSGAWVGGNNNYYDGSNYRYVVSDYATLVTQGGGDFYIRTATTGTAGNAITWNERFRVTNGGSVGIGTTSPGAKLEIASASFQDHLILNRTGVGLMHITATNPRGLAITDGTTQFMTIVQSSGNVGIGTTAPVAIGSGWGALDIRGSAGGGIWFGRADNTGSTYLGSDSSAGQLFTYSSIPLTFGTNNTERMRITSGGNVGIGLTNPQTQFHINGVMTFSEAGYDTVRLHTIDHSHSSGSDANNFMKFSVSNGSGTTVERMRIMGNNSIRYYITAAYGDTNLEWYNTSSNTVQVKIWGDGNPRLNAQVGGSGGVYLASGGVAWIASSDERLKTDLLPIENAISKVNSLRSMTGRYKTDNENIRRPFLIAQDVLEVLPEAVNKDEKTGNLGVSYSEVIPLLVASIKELKAELDTLKNK